MTLVEGTVVLFMIISLLKHRSHWNDPISKVIFGKPSKFSKSKKSRKRQNQSQRARISPEYSSDHRSKAGGVVTHRISELAYEQKQKNAPTSRLPCTLLKTTQKSILWFGFSIKRNHMLSPFGIERV